MLDVRLYLTQLTQSHTLCATATEEHVKKQQRCQEEYQSHSKYIQVQPLFQRRHGFICKPLSSAASAHALCPNVSSHLYKLSVADFDLCLAT